MSNNTIQDEKGITGIVEVSDPTPTPTPNETQLPIGTRMTHNTAHNEGTIVGYNIITGYNIIKWDSGVTKPVSLTYATPTETIK